LSTVFVGTSEFAAAILERLARSEAHRPSLVVTRPDRPRGRGRRLTPPPVAERARALAIALAQPQSVNEPGARELIAQAGRERSGESAHMPDMDLGARQTIVVCGYGALVKEPLLSEHDLLNVHPSLLPRWRGAAPIERALMAGDTQTGVSIMRMTAGLDSGPVCLAGVEPIGPQDTYGSLAERLQRLGGELLLRALDEHPPFAEQLEEGVTYAEKISSEDRLLDPTRPAVELERVVRALHPRIGARAKLPDGTLLGVQRAALLDGDSVVPAPGSEGAESGQPGGRGVLVSEGRLLLGCSPGTLELLVVQPPGGRAMDAAAYLRGHGAPGRR
jgi:methionyl-tRNA formyltransferase